MLDRLDQSALLAAWRRMGRLVHDLRIAQPRVSLSVIDGAIIGHCNGEVCSAVSV